MKDCYFEGAEVLHIAAEHMQPILDALRVAKKTRHILTHNAYIGDVMTDDLFEPPIPPRTTMGMILITREVNGKKLFWLTGGCVQEDIVRVS